MKTKRHYQRPCMLVIELRQRNALLTIADSPLAGATVMKLNKLYYPSETMTLGAMRAYFELDPSVHAPEHIIFNFNEPTGVTNLKRDTSGPEAIKFVRDGQLYILRNGVVYDALGKIAEGVSIHQ